MRAGEEGVVLHIDVGIDLENAIAVRFFKQKVGGPVVQIDISEPGAGWDGTAFEYTTVSGDFPTAGNYLLMAEVEWAGPRKLRSRVEHLVVEPVLEVAS